MNLSRAIAVATLAPAFASPAWAGFSGDVVGAADGDTMTVLDADKVQHKIRLTGIRTREKTTFWQSFKD